MLEVYRSALSGRRYAPGNPNFIMTLDLFHDVVHGRSLTEEEAHAAMRGLLEGESSHVMTAAFLTALRMKGETVEELTGFARAMRAAATTIPIAEDCRPVLDTCGTGGTGMSVFNISTVAAFVVAGAGVRVAKHGNRAISGKCGSADLLEALGVNTKGSPEVVAQAIEEVGIGFLFAPLFHGAMRHVQPVRIELKIRTAFNFLGPLTNPARAEMQVAGTWSDDAAEMIAEVSARLGLQRGFVVHGSDGLAELTVTGTSTVFSIHDGVVDRLTVHPRDFGLEVRSADEIEGGDAAVNRAIAESVLAGQQGAARDVVVMNAALALVAAGRTPDYRAAAEEAAEAIDSGTAQWKLVQLRAAMDA
jgi:anthranilate phosphoribosyltransferase